MQLAVAAEEQGLVKMKMEVETKQRGVSRNERAEMWQDRDIDSLVRGFRGVGNVCIEDWTQWQTRIIKFELGCLRSWDFDKSLKEEKTKATGWWRCHCLLRSSLSMPTS